MTTKEKARLKELERKDKTWKKRAQEFYRNKPDDEITGDELEYDGLTGEEFDECQRLQAKRYWDWVLTDNEKEEARFKELQMMDDAWRRDLEERIEKQKDEPSDTPDHQNDETPEEFEARMARESQELHLFLRHGMSEEDWSEYSRLENKRKMRLWLDFIGGNEDYDWEYLLQLLQFKIDRFADYWGRFALVENSEYYRKRMQLASRLLQIVLNRGNESGDYDKFPYRVNIRNKERFKVYHNPYAHNPCNKQEVRFNKAYCLFFKLLQKNLLSWWY